MLNHDEGGSPATSETHGGSASALDCCGDVGRTVGYPCRCGGEPPFAALGGGEAATVTAIVVGGVVLRTGIGPCVLTAAAEAPQAPPPPAILGGFAACDAAIGGASLLASGLGGGPYAPSAMAFPVIGGAGPLFAGGPEGFCFVIGYHLENLAVDIMTPPAFSTAALEVDGVHGSSIGASA